MASVKIIGGNGFNEGGAVTFATPTGVVSELTNPALNRQDLPRDYKMYGIVEYAVISAGAVTQQIRAHKQRHKTNRGFILCLCL